MFFRGFSEISTSPRIFPRLWFSWYPSWCTCRLVRLVSTGRGALNRKRLSKWYRHWYIFRIPVGRYSLSNALRVTPLWVTPMYWGRNSEEISSYIYLLSSLHFNACLHLKHILGFVRGEEQILEYMAGNLLVICELQYIMYSRTSITRRDWKNYRYRVMEQPVVLGS